MTNKVTSKKELAIRLSSGSVNINEVSKKRLERTIALWLSRNEIILSEGVLKLS